MPFNGKQRKVLLHPDRNGYLYVVDRTTGEIVSAEPYGYVNSISGVDLKTGRPIVNPDKSTRLGVDRARHLPDGVGRERTGTPPPTRRAPACCTSRTRTCAWIGRTCRPTTSPARPMSAPTS